MKQEGKVLSYELGVRSYGIKKHQIPGTKFQMSSQDPTSKFDVIVLIEGESGVWNLKPGLVSEKRD
ncbi:hypothetical protein FHG64_05640 [Antarcticibacterium flavum]|uniref:Uncharacterized protein n=1 Tax=Antarcticibacterium flavum TaxID=2058175 RepID=A0A5B7X0A0_9FLAO|nr:MULTISPECIES: hypothetical protein [Antarcticibacterium]MCM4159928.1 hypothetical protein [Antarcticibacterium sp. W02-3]QCY68926.1 hypothetical protein FHG64_05640 [Antarcticibacterium flavum]